MSIFFFFIGFVIFSAYMFFLIWNISFGTKNKIEENNPTIDEDTPVDYDGGGNWGRFPKRD